MCVIMNTHGYLIIVNQYIGGQSHAVLYGDQVLIIVTLSLVIGMGDIAKWYL